MPTRDIEAQKKAGASRDKKRAERDKVRDKAARERASQFKKDGKPVVATTSFSYFSKEQDALRPVEQGAVFHPSDEPVQHAPALFKTALQLQGA